MHNRERKSGVIARWRRPKPHVEFKVGFAGYVTVELIDVRTGLVRQRLSFRNTITDVGLQGLANNLTVSSFVDSAYIAVGTGSTAPATTDTILATEFTPQTRTNSNGGFSATLGWGAGNAYYSRKIVRLFTETQVNGNLTEFGLFSASTAGTMFARQLFKDSGGTPITVTKTSTDQLKITYELRIYPPTADDTSGSVTLATISYPFTVRALGVGSSSSAWSANSIGNLSAQSPRVHSYESNTLVATTATTYSTPSTLASPITVQAYVAGTTYRDVQAQWAAAAGNYTTGVGGITFIADGFNTSVPIFQLVFVTTKIPKDSTKILTLTVRMTFARYP